VLNIVVHDLALVCDASEIPEEIHIPLDGLEIGDSIHISQVKLPKGAKAANADDDFTVATIVAPSAMKQTEEEAAAAEGEVPTVGEEEGEGEGAAEGGAAEGGDEA
jgi:large subunit ribosomal protein L25